MGNVPLFKWHFEAQSNKPMDQALSFRDICLTSYVVDVVPMANGSRWKINNRLGVDL